MRHVFLKLRTGNRGFRWIDSRLAKKVSDLIDKLSKFEPESTKEEEQEILDDATSLVEASKRKVPVYLAILVATLTRETRSLVKRTERLEERVSSLTREVRRRGGEV
jgi:hypothetical protein